MAFSYEAEFMSPQPIGVFHDRFASELDYYDKNLGRRSLDYDKAKLKEEKNIQNLLKIDKLVNRTKNCIPDPQISKEEVEKIVETDRYDNIPIDTLIGLAKALGEDRGNKAWDIDNI